MLQRSVKTDFGREKDSSDYSLQLLYQCLKNSFDQCNYLLRELHLRKEHLLRLCTAIPPLSQSHHRSHQGRDGSFRCGCGCGCFLLLLDFGRFSSLCNTPATRERANAVLVSHLKELAATIIMIMTLITITVISLYLSALLCT